VGTILAPIAVWSWAALCVALFALLRPPVALAIGLIGGTMLLPVHYVLQIEGLPDINRDVATVLACTLGAVLFAWRDRVRRPLGVEWFAVAALVGIAGTVVTNREATISGPRQLAGLSLWSGVSMAADFVLRIWLPFALARRWIRDSEDLRSVLRVLVVAGLLYSVPMLWEARMSPRLHEIVYGVSPAAFGQQVRPGGLGWRPMVFIGHGLALAAFAVSTALAAAALTRARTWIGRLPISLPIPIYLYGIVVVCASMAATVYATFCVPAVLRLRARTSRRLLVALCVMILSYPLARAVDVFPTRLLVHLSSRLSTARAASLKFRFDMEDLLIERANGKPWFGWGGFGRSRRYGFQEIGRWYAVTDGYWMIVYGVQGAVGFLSIFGLLLYPVWRAARRKENGLDSSTQLLFLGVAWMAVIGTLDFLPNAFLTPRHLLIAGALAGALASRQTVDTVSHGEGSPLPEPPPPTATGASLGSGLLQRPSRHAHLVGISRKATR